MRLNFCFRLYEEWAKKRKNGKTTAGYGDIGSVEDKEEKRSNFSKDKNNKFGKRISRPNSYKPYHQKNRTHGNKQNFNQVNQVYDPNFNSPPGYIRNYGQHYNQSHFQHHPQNYSQNLNKNHNRNYKHNCNQNSNQNIFQNYSQNHNQQYFDNWGNNSLFNQGNQSSHQQNNHGQYRYHPNAYW